MSAFSDEISELQAPTFSGMALDRAVDSRRDKGRIESFLAEPTSRVLVAGSGGVLLDHADPQRVARKPIEAGTLRSAGSDEPLLLGLEDGAALFAVDLDRLDPRVRADLQRGATVVALRDAGATLSRSEAGLTAYLAALLNWHRRNRFCGNCGAGTSVAEAGYSRPCPQCGVTHFPRTDPVVIMLVEHAGRLLLGRRAGWPGNQYSVLAGFVSPGESLEEAVVREVREESGIEAYDTRFIASQPWPFPSSLMLGFEARSDGGEPMALDGELADVRWFTLDDVRAASRSDRPDLRLPPPISIARLLIDRWLARHRPEAV